MLPAHATPASQHRLELAHILARSCPTELAAEIALTGSAARGLADDESDLEVNFWVERLPPADDRLNWLYAMGLRDYTLHLKPRPDNSYWISGIFMDIPLEAGWQTFSALETALAPLLAGDVIERKPLTLVELIASAVPLKTQGYLVDLQEKTRLYPPALRQKLIEAALKMWLNEERSATMLRLAARGERLALVDYLRDDLDMMVRLLYAANGRWEAGAKWALTLARDLTVVPVYWESRLAEVFASPLDRAIALCRALCDEALMLAQRSER
jgi:hypothetical protein